MDSHPPLVRTRLSAMMFLEFFVWGSWGVAITGYAQHLRFSDSELGWLASVPAIGAIISPLFVGLIADRFFAAQRVLCVLHLLGGVFLIIAGFQDTFWPLMIAMLLNGLAFMPTLALVNSVAFRHIPDPDRFPRIAVLGTLGWIAANLLAEVFGGAATSNFLLQAGVGGIVLALYALTLPDTPPKGAEAGGDVFGLSALKLLKDPTFLIFIVCVFLFSIPACGYFFALMVPMLQQRGYPGQLALGTLNQIAEIVFMFSMPWFVAKLGLKRVLLIGMTAWTVRYVCFACPEFSMAVVGLLLHGFCYSFFYVGAYMYVDRRAPAELKSSAQSLVAFLVVGVGYLLGAQGAGFMKSQFTADLAGMPAVNQETGEATENAILPRWDDPQAATSVWRFLNLSGTVKGLLQSPEEKAKQEEKTQVALLDQLDADGDGRVSPAEIDAAGDAGLTVDDLGFSKDEITKKFEGIQKSLGLAGNASVERSSWLVVTLKPDLLKQLDTDGDEKISLAEVEAVEEAGVYVDGFRYASDDLRETFGDIHDVLGLQTDAPLTRKDWLKVQSNKWAPIWLWPSAAAFSILAVFALAFRDKPPEEKSPAEGSGGPEETAPDQGQ